MNLTGLLHFPNTTVGFEGNPRSNCTVLIASRVQIDGDSRMATARCASAGLASLPTVYTVALAE